MQVMGVDPFEALVLPRFAALLITIPLLTFIATLAGLLGGLMVTWSTLGLGPTFFLQRIVDNVGPNHFYIAPVQGAGHGRRGRRHRLSPGSAGGRRRRVPRPAGDLGRGPRDLRDHPARCRVRAHLHGARTCERRARRGGEGRRRTCASRTARPSRSAACARRSATMWCMRTWT